MYCDKCHRQSPDNFVNCPYCSAPLKNHKRRKPTKFVKKKETKKPVSFKSLVIGAVVVALVLSVAAVVTGIFTGSKPTTAVETMVNAIENDNAELYYSLFDEQTKEYYKENWYYDDEETFNAMTEPLTKSVEFYTSKCGENFTLKYKITDVTYLTEDMLESHNNALSVSYGFTKLPDKVALLNFELEAKGDLGTYKSVYENFVCSQIGGKWYKTASTTVVDEND